MTLTAYDIETRRQWLRLPLAAICRAARLDYHATRRSLNSGRGLDEDGLARLDAVLKEAENELRVALGRTLNGKDIPPSSAPLTSTEILWTEMLRNPAVVLQLITEAVAETAAGGRRPRPRERTA